MLVIEVIVFLLAAVAFLKSCPLHTVVYLFYVVFSLCCMCDEKTYPLACNFKLALAYF